MGLLLVLEKTTMRSELRHQSCQAPIDGGLFGATVGEGLSPCWEIPIKRIIDNVWIFADGIARISNQYLENVDMDKRS